MSPPAPPSGSGALLAISAPKMKPEASKDSTRLPEPFAAPPVVIVDASGLVRIVVSHRLAAGAAPWRARHRGTCAPSTRSGSASIRGRDPSAFRIGTAEYCATYTRRIRSVVLAPLR
jgi:hypothetical protein